MRSDSRRSFRCCRANIRDPSWHTVEVYKLLQAYNAAFCIYNLDGCQAPIKITANFVYVRLHGPGRKYEGSYTQEKLQEWASQIQKWKETVRSIYVYFDNDQDAHAARNAIALRRILGAK